MFAYKSLTDSTVVTDSLHCNFTGEQNLVVAKSSLLQIFKLVKFKSVDVALAHNVPNGETITKLAGETDSFMTGELGLERSMELYSTKMVLMAQFQLQGIITDLGKIRTSADKDIDYLLIAFKTAKVSLVKWDFETLSLTTVSLHYYEKKISELCFYDSIESLECKLKIDPNNNCACVLLPGDQLSFLSFQQDDSLMDTNVLTETISQPSFVLPIATLDESVGNVIDSNFLYQYREPTIGVLYQHEVTCSGNLMNRKDTMRYLVLSIDLQQRSSTAILSVNNLPYDINTIVPLSESLNGSLLIGSNVLVHVDTSGKTLGVAVNKFAAISTDFKLLDSSDQGIFLEGCKATTMIGEKEKVLLILDDGSFYTVDFRLEGRSVKGITVTKLETDITVPTPSSMTIMDNRTVFVGSATSMSQLLSWKHRGEKISEDEEKQEVPETDRQNDFDELDDLYNEGPSTFVISNPKDGNSKNYSKAPIIIEMEDSLTNAGPMSDFTFAKSREPPIINGFPNPSANTLEIVATSGYDSTGSLTVFNQHVMPEIVSALNLPNTDRLWALSFSNLGSDETNVMDEYLVTSSIKSANTSVYKIGHIFEKQENSKFHTDSATLDLGSILGGQFSVQITENRISLYNSTLRKVQGLTMPEGKENAIKSTFINDPYVVVVTQKGSLHVYEIGIKEQSGKPSIKPFRMPSRLQSVNLVRVVMVNRNSSLKFPQENDKTDIKRDRDNLTVINNSETNVTPILLLATKDNQILMFKMSSPEDIFELSGASKLENLLIFKEWNETNLLNKGSTISSQQTFDSFISDLIITSIGDSINKQEYLTIITNGGETYIYRLFQCNGNSRFLKEKDLAITGAAEKAYPKGTQIKRRLISIGNISGYSAVFITGITPYIIMKAYQGPVRIHRFSKTPVMDLSSFNTKSVFNGFISIDHKKVGRVGTLSNNFNYEGRWPTRQIFIGETIRCIVYDEVSDVYVASTLKRVPYHAVSEEGEPLTGTDDDLPSAETFQGYIKLISPINWKVIDEIPLEENQIALSLKMVDLKVLSKQRQTKRFLAIGTGKYRVEDLATLGSLMIYQIISVVPEPGKPETNRKFKLVVKEDVKGAVSTICEVGGRLLCAQGQKILIRDLQDDNSMSPVAFVDMAVYISESKNLGNLLLLGDAMNSVVFVGFDVSFNDIILFENNYTFTNFCL